MGALKEWAKKNSPFLSLGDGEMVEAEYMGFKIVGDSRNPDKDKPVYKLGVLNEDGSKVVKMFETAAGKVARFFDRLSDEKSVGKPIRQGIMVRITRHGLDTATKYTCVELDATGQPVEPVSDEDPPDF